MRISKIMLLIAIGLVALSHRSDGQQARPVAEQMRLAGVMPRGAIIYVQAANLGGLMKTWLGSSVRAQFYKSLSFAAFSRSHIYLKLQDRRKDFESAIGFGLDEARLAELAGGASAVAVYDVGKLELVFATEVPRERAVATVMFKQAPQFQERAGEEGTYYVRDVTTDGGRLNQQFCFAYAGGKLIVATTEGLMIRALANVKAAGAEALLADVLATADQAKGFAAHDVTMWLDQARLNRNRHFNNYWVYGNAREELAAIASGIIDLRITPEGLSEQRWFKMGAEAQAPATVAADQANQLLRFAPADAQLVEVRAGAVSKLGEAVSQALFGRLPDKTGEPPDAPDHTRSTDSEGDSTVRHERYSRLDTRFDRDIDDEQSLGKPEASVLKSQASSLKSEALTRILAQLAPVAYCEMVRSKNDAGKPFVRFERAVVIELGAAAALDRAALERTITDELRARFVVAGVEPLLSWQEDAAVRYVAQPLVEQGAAYSISGKHLILASSRELLQDALKSAAGAQSAAAPKIEGQVDFYALVRVASAKPVFDLLMSKLDGRTAEAAPARTDEEEREREVKFFSDNLSSLVAASAVREVRVRRETAAGMMTERVVYAW
jgi:hypothetical protein